MSRLGKRELLAHPAKVSERTVHAGRIDPVNEPPVRCRRRKEGPRHIDRKETRGFPVRVLECLGEGEPKQARSRCSHAAR